MKNRNLNEMYDHICLDEKYAKQLFKQLAQSNDYQSISILLRKHNLNKSFYKVAHAVAEIIKSGNIELAAKVFDNADIDHTAYQFLLIVQYKCFTNANLLHFLACIQSQDLREAYSEFIAEFSVNSWRGRAVKELSHINPTQVSLVKANKLNQLMNQYQLAYNDVRYWLLPEFQQIQTLFLHGAGLIREKGLDLEILLKIAFHLSSVTMNEIRSIYKLTALNVNRSIFFDDLNKYTSYFSNPMARHRERAESLKNACMQVKISDELLSLLDKQISLFDDGVNVDDQNHSAVVEKHDQALINRERGSYFNLIKKHEARLSFNVNSVFKTSTSNAPETRIRCKLKC